MIPLLDLDAQHAAIREEMDAAIAQVLEHGKYVNGPEVVAFEQEFAGFCRASEAIGVSSGTSALSLGLKAAGVGPGDEVITTAMTFIATAEAIVEVGAIPTLVDPDPDTGLMTVDAVEAAIGPQTRAVLVVHLWGQTVDLDAFRELADRHGLVLGEDAAQAHGAEWNGRRAGTVGDFAGFSFFPGKNLGCLGDGGALTTGSSGLAQRVRSLRDHGRTDKYSHHELGTNARLDTIQAAVLSTKLPHLEAWNAGRRANAAEYDRAFGEGGARPISVAPEATHVYHQYVVRVPDRDTALTRLREAGVTAGVHYPIPLNRQPAMASLVKDADAFPAADRLAGEILSLPVFPELTTDQREAVVRALENHVNLLTGSPA